MKSNASRRRLLLAASTSLLFAAPAAASAQIGAVANAAGATAAEAVTADAPAAPASEKAGIAPTTTQIEEVVVTATRQGATQLQRTPMAVSVLSASNLDQSGVNNVKDIGQLIPNLSFSQTQSGALIYIRGIGTNVAFNGSDPDVTVQVDGVYMARSFESFTDFVDIDRIEVLRGPQGTLYGRNAVGGVINVISRLPTDDFVAKEQVTVGDYDLFQNQAYISGAIIKGVLDASLSTNYIRHEGYDKNIGGGARDDGANHGGVRLQIRYRPTDWIDAITRADYSRYGEHAQVDDHLLAPQPFNVPLANSLVGQFRTVALNDNPHNNEITDGVSEEINVKINDSVALKSISAYRYGHIIGLIDLDASEKTVSNIRPEDTSRQASQEFDLNGHFNDLNYVLGAYYYRERDVSDNLVLSPNSVANPVTSHVPATFVESAPNSLTTSKAVFAQASYPVTSSVKITAGARYTEDEKGLVLNTKVSLYPAPPAVGPTLAHVTGNVDRTFHSFTPKATVEWQAAPDAMLYFTYAKGFKSGGNNGLAASLVDISYAPEKLTSYEVGAKTEFLDHRLRLNLTVFDYDYTDLQVQGIPAPGVSIISNAATATVRGAEFESIFKPTSQLVFTANVAYLDATYDTFKQSSVPKTLIPYVATSPRYVPALTAYDASGNTLNNAPKYSYSLTGQYTQPLAVGEAYGRVEYAWQDRIFFDPSNAAIMSQKAYGLLNLAVGYTSPGSVWTAEVMVKNALDQNYYLNINASGTAPGGLSGAPRTVALRVARNF